MGYSPERINPGDQVNTMERIDKLVSSQNIKITKLLKSVYEKIIKKVHTVDSIKIAEAAKVIENTQRDLNIALVNEFNMIFSKSNLDTYKILKAASTNGIFLILLLISWRTLHRNRSILLSFFKKNRY